MLEFWFGPLDEHGCASAERTHRWWNSTPELDAEVAQRFGALHQRAETGSLDSWRAGARGTLALVLVLDQLSRHLYRDTARMYTYDTRATQIALGAIEEQRDRALRTDERAFMYMPLMHAEDLELQEQCVRLFEQLAREVPEAARPKIERQLDFARRHRDIVQRFGRFPHRNAILRRSSTPQEEAFLKQPGSSF